MYYKDTEVAGNCNVFNDHQSLSRIIDARRGTGRLHTLLGGKIDELLTDRQPGIIAPLGSVVLRLLAPFPLGMLGVVLGIVQVIGAILQRLGFGASSEKIGLELPLFTFELLDFFLALASWCAGSAIKRPCKPVPVTYAPGAHGPDARRRVHRSAARLPARPRPVLLVATNSFPGFYSAETAQSLYFSTRVLAIHNPARCRCW